MTETDERAAFLAKIGAEPDEDTHRLVFADWLEEHDDPLGEFIRVQCELATCLFNAMPMHSLEHNYVEPQNTDVPAEVEAANHCNAEMKRTLTLKRREYALLAPNRERWLRVPCPECRGTGDETSDGQGRCLACNGTGGTGGLIRRLRNDTRTSGNIEVVFRRGFPDEVRGCQLEDVLTWDRVGNAEDMSDRHDEWCPTNWIARVLAHHPTIRRMPLTDFEPLHHTGVLRSGYSYVGGDHGPTAPYALPPALLHEAGWDGAEPTDHSHGYSVWKTADEVRDRVALAVPRVIRKYIKETA